MAHRIDFTLDGEPFPVEIAAAYAAGYTGRDQTAVQEHTEELRAQGIAPPPHVPMLYPLMPTLLTTSQRIHVLGDASTPEVEVAFVRAGGRDYVTVCSDQTDRRAEAVSIPQYDFERHTRKDTERRLEPEPIVVLEGILALYHEQIRAEIDLAVYVQTDADVRVLRRLQRDIDDRGRTVEGVVEHYLSTVKPMHEQFVQPTKRDADIIIPEGSNPKAIELLREKARSEIES